MKLEKYPIDTVPIFLAAEEQLPPVFLLASDLRYRLQL
jgi:hypothetical protein